MYKAIGIGLLGLFVLLVLPTNSNDEVNPMFYGTASMVLADPNGNELLTQTVHNLITDEGEQFIIDQVFDTGDVAITDDQRVGAICIIGGPDSIFSETATDALTSTITHSGPQCQQYTDVTDSDSTAKIGPVTFTTGTHVEAGAVISGILICAKHDGDANFKSCSTPAESVAFAAINLANVTMAGTDTVSISYTFDITTPST